MSIKGGGGGGGGGVHPDYFEKLDFEITVDKQTKARDRTFEVVPARLQVPTGARGTATPIFGQFVAQFCQMTLTCSKP